MPGTLSTPLRAACLTNPRLPTAAVANAPRSLHHDVRMAQAGHADAFARVYDSESPRLFAVCVGLTGSREAAAELMQDTFVRAWERLASFRGDSALGTWLHRIAVNVMLEQERARRRRTLRVASESDLATANEAPLDAAIAPPDVAAALDLEQAITRLPEGCRRVFVLHDIAGYAHAEIATQLDIAEGTCKAHLFRARRLLRGMLDR